MLTRTQSLFTERKFEVIVFMEKELRIALAGNPNCGKTTLFNALTGLNQYVGNWPGVTVEKKEGKLKKYEGVIVTDLPGVYSLSPYTLEEVVARNYLTVERPDAILNIVDGTNIERNLYLTTQLMELGIPVVVAVNMLDILRKQGDKINIEKLSERLNCPVFEISALKGVGIDETIDAAVEAAKRSDAYPEHIFSGLVEHALAHIEEAAVHDQPREMQRWYAIKIFERDEKAIEQLGLDNATIEHIEDDIVEVEKRLDDDAESIITNERYLFVARILDGVYKKKRAGRLSTSDKIDNIVTNRWLALPIFALIMFFVYFISIGSVGAFAVDFMNEGLFGSFSDAASNGVLPSFMSSWVSIPELLDMALLNSAGDPTIPAWLYSLIQDGIVGGVGAVLGFVPQMIILFVFLSFLEACGYMSRIAFVMDKIFRKFGLSGKSFIPMIVGTGCSVPGIMASRTIENLRDRRMTVITTSFIPCSAKLPVIALISGVMFGHDALSSALVSVSAFFVGILAVVLSGIILKKMKRFAGDVSPFVMELPAYHMPTLKNMLRTVGERAWSFIKKAGTVILLSAIVLWFLQYFGFEGGAFVAVTDASNSLLSYIGRPLAYLFIPLGFGFWQAAVAVITGLIAKENIVATIGVLYGVAEVSENGAEVWAAFKGALGPTESIAALAAFSFLVFNLLCAPCFAAVGAIKREMNSGKWTLFAVGYQCALAYAFSLVIYQVGLLFVGGFGVVSVAWSVVGLVAAAIVLALGGYLLFRPDKNKKKSKI